jgi:hypothetical protein
VVERLGHRQDPEAADAAVGGLQSDHAIGRRRKPDRASGVGSDRGIRQAGRGGDTGSARRQPRPSIAVPRVEGHVERGVVASCGAFREIQFAQQHGARRTQLRHDGRVYPRDEIPADRRPAHRSDTLRIAEIFHGHGDTVQRPAILAGPDFQIGRACGRHRLLRGDGGVALEVAVDVRDPVQNALRQLDRRQLARGDAPADLFERQIVNVLQRTGPSGGSKRRDLSGGDDRKRGSCAEDCQRVTSGHPPVGVHCGWTHVRHGGCRLGAGAHRGVASSHGLSVSR